MPKSDKTFRVRIREWRTSRGLALKQAADFFSVTYSCYRSWEDGRRTPCHLSMLEIQRRMEK